MWPARGSDLVLTNRQEWLSSLRSEGTRHLIPRILNLVAIIISIDILQINLRVWLDLN